MVDEKEKAIKSSRGRTQSWWRSSRAWENYKITKLQQDVENDPITKDQMGSLGCLLVCTFGNLVAPVLVAVHTMDSLDLGDENEGYKSD